jgi:hypothetical protein
VRELTSLTSSVNVADAQVNLGERVLRGLLCRWRERHAALIDGARTSQLEQVRDCKHILRSIYGS